MKKKLSGEEKFDLFYSSIYQDRWTNLKNALLNEKENIKWMNQFADELDSSAENNLEFSNIPRAKNGLLKYYILDQASAWVAESLQVSSKSIVLDMCAAPGGKSLILANRLFANLIANSISEADINEHNKNEHNIESNNSEHLKIEFSSTAALILNELSPGRRERLFKVVQNYIPRDVRNQVQITGKDGLRFGMIQPETYDAILLDAPCSGEKHLLENKRELESWSEMRTKGLAQKQYGLLTSALLALKPGGHLIYSTCSISPLENDGVIAKLIKKKGSAKKSNKEEEKEEVKEQEREEFSIRKDLLKAGPGAEQTEYGLMYLPDRASAGPMYCCSIVKNY